MKLFVFLFAIILATAMGKISSVKKMSGRTTVPETVDISLLYLGSCEEFNPLHHHIKISSLQNGNPTFCLPISDTPNFLSTDDLKADVMCTNIGKNRAQIDFVEIYQTTESVPYTGGYAISFIPNAPFKALSSVSYLRKPSCTTQKDFCSTTNYVLSCTDNSVVFEKGFVISKDEIFIVPSGSVVVGCAQTANSCCGYVTPGFCPRTAPSETIKFNWASLEEHHQQQQQQQQHQDNDFHQDDHDDDHDDQDNHQENHQDNHQENHKDKHQENHQNNHQNNNHQNNGHQNNQQNNHQNNVVFNDDEDDKKKK